MKKMVCIIVVLLVAMVNVASANLLAHWSFDTDFTDVSANSFNLSAAGGASIASGGKIGGAASFSRALSQYASVTFAENAMFTPGEDYTVTTWYKLNVADMGSNRYMVFESAANYTASYGLRKDATLGDVGQVYVVTSSAANMMFNPGANEEWHHIAVTYNHSTGVVNAYVDGVFANTMTKGGTLKASTAFYIGTYRSHNDRYWEGLIDDTAVWDEALSAQMVAADYAMGLFEGLNVENTEIDNLLTAFNANGAELINTHNWKYTTGLTGVLGATGGSIASGDAFVILDGNGNGMMIPEPATVCLLTLGSLLFVRRNSK